MKSVNRGKTRNILVWCIMLLLADSGLRAEAFKPGADSFVVERLPRSLVALRKSMPKNAPAKVMNAREAASLAREYLQIGQRTSDPAFVRYAEAVLEPVQAEASAEVTFLGAVIRQHKHDFTGALSQLTIAQKLAGATEEIEELRASIFLTQGKYDEVRTIFARQLRLTSRLQGLTLLLTATSLSGSLVKSEQTLETAINPRAQPQEQAFASCALAEMATRRGDDRLAETRFRRALELNSGDSYALAAYCDLLLALGRPAEVLDKVEANTSSEALLTRRLLAAKTTGAPATQFEGQLRKSAHHREIAMLELELFQRPEVALAHALENWEKQKEPIDSLLVMRCALAARHPNAAKLTLDWWQSVRTEDVRMEKLVSEVKKACQEL